MVFEEVLYEMNSYFRVKDKKILLLVDNTPSHFNSYCSLAEQDEQDEDSTNKKIEPASIFGKIFVNELMNFKFYFIFSYKN